MISLLIGYPAAYFVARFAGPRKGLFLVLLIAPFWISYMMRMLAWIDLLQTDGYVNKALGLVGIGAVNWLGGNPVTVVLGLVYGYIPYLILVLYAGLDRIDPALIEAGRDLGLGRAAHLPAGDPAAVPAADPDRVADHRAADARRLLHQSDALRRGQHIDAGQRDRWPATDPGAAGPGRGALAWLLLAVLLVPMIYYVVATNRSSREAT